MADYSEHPQSGAGHVKPPSTASLFVTGLLLIAVLMGVAAVAGRMEAKATAPAAATPAPAPAPEAPAAKSDTPPAPAPTEVLAAEVKALKSQLDGLSAQINGVREKVDGLPKPAPAPDLKPIQGKLDDLSKSLAAVAPLSEKVSKLDERLGAIGGKVEGLGTEVVALKNAAAKPAAPPAPAPTPVEAPKVKPSGDEADAAVGEAADLFKKGRYKDALDRLRGLTEADAKDARVWYYAALASGLVTANWTGGEAVTFVKKGVEREKAGSPTSAKIDAVFSDLTPKSGKDWLAYYRKTAK